MSHLFYFGKTEANTRYNNNVNVLLSTKTIKHIRMGVYIIKSKHANWFKVGHHKISASRPNVYYRYINRGFYSVRCPPELQNRVGFWDVELLYFFKNLNVYEERRIHRDLRAI